MKKRLWIQAVGLAAWAILALPAVVVAAASDGSDETRPTLDKAVALVQLKGDPVATSVKTQPAHGRKIDFNSNRVKAYRAQLSALRNDFKAWLRTHAPNARVTGEFDIALNAVSVSLGGERLETLAAAPMVQRAEYQGLYYPTDSSDPDLALIRAQQSWNMVGGGVNAGRGVKVAIVDSGIDVTHPCFGDSGYSATTQVGDRRYTNNKVIAAKVFHMRAGVARFTPEAINSHGTHVAGTVACNLDTPAAVDGVTIPYSVSGVAPAALLGNYNVFPGEVGGARSEDILNALDAAYADGFDVANMSLGGGASGIQDLLTIAVDNLDQANMVVAVAAGNSGPGHFTVGSPGSAARALTAGASTVPHFVGVPVAVGPATYGAASGDFAIVASNLTAPLGVVAGSIGGLSTACAALAPGSLTGKIAVISRGTCTFSTKLRNAQNAGAVAVLVTNNTAGDPTAMGTDGTPNQPTVPAYMMGLASRAALVSQNGVPATIGETLAYFATASANIMAGFSSRGPTDVDFRVKPDVVAPGVNVLSSIPHAFCSAAPCWAFFGGTSMATPHLAGAAAVVRGASPAWSAAQVRSAIVNTASAGVLTDFATGKTVVSDVNIVGTGLANLQAAVGAAVALDPVSISYGAVPDNSGQTREAVLTITNLGSSALNSSVAISTATGAGVTFSAPAAVSLAPGGSTTITVTMSATKGASPGGHQAILRLNAGGVEVANAVLYAVVK